MKAALKQQEVFTVEVGGLTLKDVRIESQWCGLAAANPHNNPARPPRRAPTRKEMP